VKNILMTLLLALASTPLASAHEGHAKKVMGTVAAIKSDHLQITTAPGRSSMIMVNGKTRVLKGQAAQTAGDSRSGTAS